MPCQVNINFREENRKVNFINVAKLIFLEKSAYAEEYEVHFMQEI